MAIPAKLITPLVAAIAGAGGLIMGALIRQPEINDLHKQVRSLQKNSEQLLEVVRAQNSDIAEMEVRYQALKAYQVFQRSDLKKQIKESLVFQYATSDYFELVLHRIDSGRDFDDAEAGFYLAFSQMLVGKTLSPEQKQIVFSYTKERHASEIEAMRPCDVEGIIDRLMKYEANPQKRGFEFPGIELPKVELPRIDMPQIPLPKINIPFFGHDNDAQGGVQNNK